MSNQCSPNKQKSFTCFSKNDLIYICKSYNSSNNEKINIKNKSKKELWRKLRERLKDDCKNEMCWLKQKFIPESVSSKHFKETFKPEYPKEWF